MNPRYSIIPAGAVTDPRIEPRDLQVLCLLGRHINDIGWCRRSQVKMAHELSCARSTLQASLDRLIDAGWVEKRPEPKTAKGDSAHSYRVRLDVSETDSFYADISKAGRGKSRVEPAEESDNSANSIEQPADRSAPSRHPVPIHASAPLTSPVKREEEREGAREDLEKDSDPEPSTEELTVNQTWRALTKVWPDIALQSETMARAALEKRTGQERKTLVDRVPDFLALHREKQGKAKLPFLHNYIGEKHRWGNLPVPKSASIASGADDLTRSIVQPFDRPWWWLFFDCLKRNELTQARRQSELAKTRIGWRIDPSRRDEIDEAGKQLVQIEVDGDAFKAWQRIVEDLPRPDKARMIFVPSEFPPKPQGITAKEIAEAWGDT